MGDSVQVKVRLDPVTHARLKAEALRRGKPLNAVIAEMLAMGVVNDRLDDLAARVAQLEADVQGDERILADGAPAWVQRLHGGGVF